MIPEKRDRLVLIPGMGADARLFEPQRERFPNLIVPIWIAPAKDESLSSYARRLATENTIPAACVVGGASFGGFVALEMAEHVNARAVILIGSVRGPAELPRPLRALKPLKECLTSLPVEVLRLSARSSATVPILDKTTRSLAAQFGDAESDFIRWACRAVLTWSTPPEVRIPIFQIHGARDPILPPACTRPDVVVPGAGHVVSYTHADIVNNFIEDVLTRVAADRTSV